MRKDTLNRHYSAWLTDTYAYLFIENGIAHRPKGQPYLLNPSKLL